VALQLAHQGWSVAVLGQQAGALRETASFADSGTILPQPCDVTDAEAVAHVRDRLMSAWEGVDAIVNAAGTNIPRRALADVSVADFTRVMEVNLLGAFHVVHAFLPFMRGRDRATIVNVASDAGLIGNAKAGAGYVASKFAMSGLIESINAELRGEGIRGTAIYPGDIDTPFLEKRPVPPDAKARAGMLQAEDVADCVMLAINLPHRAVLEKLVVRPR
jgi:NADP-dependent 3-hydroxy acid dehydrogenase YdfG